MMNPLLWCFLTLVLATKSASGTLAAPSISHGPVTDGDTVTLTCTPDSPGTYTYEFFIDLVSEGLNSSDTLTVSNVSLANASLSYTCEVSNGTETSNQSAPFQLTVKPKTPTVTGTSALVDGSATTLTCTSLSVFVSTATYEWLKDGVPISGDNSSTYTIPAVTLADDGSTFTCSVTYNGVQSDNSSNSLELTVVPQQATLRSDYVGAVEDGSDFNLTCSTPSTGIVSETYVYRIDNVQQTASSDSTLTQTANINSISTYACSVSGTSANGGNIHSPISLYFTPTVKPKTPTVNGTSTLTDGDVTTLTCTSRSTFTSSATYEWLKNGAPISGAILSDYTIPAVTMVDDGSNFTCSVTYNRVQSDTSSNSVVLAVKPKTPSVNGTSTLNDGDVTTLTCTSLSSFTSSATYEWFKDGAPISGDNSSTYTIPAVTFADDGSSFTCSVTYNGIQSDNSSNSLVLRVKPITPSVNGTSTVTDGDVTTLTCTSLSMFTNSATYEWLKNGVPISGDNSSSYTTPSVTMADDASNFTCSVIYNGVQSDISNNSIVLTVIPQQATLSADYTGAVEDGSSFTLTCSTPSTGIATETYMFQIDNTTQTASSTSTLMQTANINSISTYACSISADGGNDYSAVSVDFTPAVKPRTPTVTGTSTITDGDVTTLTCASFAMFGGVTTYEWYKNAAPISGAASSIYIIPVVTTADSGNSYTCSVTYNGVRSNTSSNSLVLRVKPETPTVSGTSTLTDGDVTTLTCTSRSTFISSVTYEWLKNGAPISGDNSSSYTTSNVTVADDGNTFTCSVTYKGVKSDTSSNSVVLTVVPQQATLSADYIGAVEDGSSFNLTCDTPSTGIATETYMFQIDNTTQTASTDSNLMQTANINSISTYACSVSADGGNDYSAVSVDFTPTVKPMTPSVTGTSTITDGGDTLLTCTSSSTFISPATYEWLNNATPISGATSSTYNTSTVTLVDSGNTYTCSVTYNGVQSDTSSNINSVVLTVKPITPSVSGTSTLTDGEDTTLSCTSASTFTSSPTYVWYKNASPISGAVSSTHTTATVTLGDNGDTYTCSVTYNGVQSDTSSNNVVLTVKPSTPTVNGTSTVTDGDDTTLACTSLSAGTSSVTYEWLKNGAPINETISVNYTLTAVTFADDGDTFTCSLTYNGVQSDNSSNSLVLRVKPKTPSVSGTSTLTDGDNTTLTCTSASTFTNSPTYDWYKNAIPIGGANLSTYTTPTVTLVDNGDIYACSVTYNGVQSDTSSNINSVVLTVKPIAPSVSGTSTLTDGDDTTLSCTSASTFTSSPTYGWYKNASPISGAVSSTHTTATVTLGDNGDTYTCSVTYNGVQSDTSSNNVVLTVKPSTPTVNGTSTVTDGDDTTLTCTSLSAGTSSVTYEWLKNGAPINGTVSSNYTLTAVTFADDGDTFTCSLTYNGVQSDNSSNSLVLRVKPKTPSVSGTSTLTDGDNTTLTCTSTSMFTSSPTYDWYKNAIPISGANLSTYTTPTVTLVDNGDIYNCSVTYNGVQSDTSSNINSAVLTVKPKTPSVSGTSTLTDGEDTTLSCTSASTFTSSPTYGWYKNASPISGAVSSTHTTATVTLGDNGDTYTCSVTYNGVQSDTSSNNVVLTVEPSTPTVSGTSTVTDGDDTTLTCTSLSAGTSSVTYEWLKNGAPINGTVSSNYTLTAVTFADDGDTFTCSLTYNGVQSDNSSNSLVLRVKPKTPSVSGTSTLTDGDNTTLTCTSTSMFTNSPTYDWYKNAIPISGANLSTYTTPTVTLVDNGDIYACSVTYNGVQSDTSSNINSVVLTVKPITPSVSGTSTLTDGEDTTLSCTSASTFTSSPTYVWYKNASPISGAVSSTHTTATVTLGDNGDTYTCSVTYNGVQSDTSSNNVVLTVKPSAPTVNGTSTVTDGDDTTLTCTPLSAGTSSVTYEWLKNGAPINGTISSNYTLTAVTLADDGDTFTCSVTYNGVQSDNSSNSLVLRVQVQTPAVRGSGGETLLTVDDGSSVNLTCTTASAMNLTPNYTWYSTGDQVLAGQSGASYTLSAVSLANSGTIKCSITYNNVQSSLSKSFPLSVKPSTPSINGPATTVGTGSSAVLTCTTSSLPPAPASLTYVWVKDNSTVLSETSSRLVFDPASVSDTGNFTCSVTFFGADSDVSAAFPLMIRAPPAKPTITPSSLTVGTGDSVTLSCDTTSSPASSDPFSYTWTKGGTHFNASTQVLSFAPADITDSGSYVCSVTDGALDSPNSNAYAFTVVQTQMAPSITKSPSTFDLGDAVTLTCVPSVTGNTYSYTWSRDGTTLSETGSQLSISNFTAGDTGTFTCAVVDQGVVSPASTGTILAASSAPPKPSIIVSPVNFTTGENVTLTCSGSAISYEWYKDGVIMNGENASTVTFATFTSTDTAVYACVATSVSGAKSPVSDSVPVSVQGAPAQPALSVSPAVITANSTVNLTCTSQTSGILTYLWFKDTSPVLHQGSSLFIPAFEEVSDGGTYSCQVSLSGEASLMSAPATLRAAVAPAAPAVALSDNDVVTEENVTLTCTPVIPGNYLYNWFLSGSPVPSETSSTYHIASASMTDGGNYSCSITDSQGLVSLPSPPQTLTVTEAPSKPQIQLMSGIVLLGGNVSLLCSNTSIGTFTYVWQKLGDNILPNTASTLSFPALASTDLGSYRCAVVASNVTSLFSEVFVLSETAAPNKPNVTYTPSSFEIGSSVAITCDVSPTDPSYTYTWTKNGSALTSEVSQVINYTAFALTDFGDYACTVHHGAALSSPSSDPVNIVALYSPRDLTLSPSSVMPSTNVIAGDSFTVTCGAACVPTCSFTWTKSGQSSAISTTPQLSFSTLSTGDSGTYNCTVTNSKGSDTLSFLLTVDAVPQKPLLTVQPVSFTIGDAVNLTCSTITTGSSIRFAWQKNGIDIPVTSSSFNIANYSNSDTGSYSCLAESNSLQSQSSDIEDVLPSDAPPKPAVSQSPPAPSLGDQVTLTCNGTGTYRWYKDGVLVTGQTSSLYTFPALAISDVGNYSCDVTSAQSVRSLPSDPHSIDPTYGPAQNSMTLTYGTNNLTRDGQTVYIVSGSLLELQCRAQCNEECSFFWRKRSDTSSTLSSTFNLTLHDLQQRDDGTYVCTATNTLGAATMSMSIIVTAGGDASRIAVSVVNVLLSLLAAVLVTGPLLH